MTRRRSSSRFVDEIPVVSRGFEIETEITLQALYRGLVVVEVPVRCGAILDGVNHRLCEVPEVVVKSGRRRRP